MKNFTVASLLLLAVVACKKEEEAAPEVGAGYSEATLPVTTRPFTGSGTVSAVRKDTSNVEISAKLSITQNGSTNLIVFPAPYSFDARDSSEKW